MREMHTTHGMTRSIEFRIWAGIKTRCFNRNDPGYVRYGGRGITICDRWKNSFEAFYADVGPKPEWADSIDRIDNNGNYEPGNVAWATTKEQANNRRTNRIITYRGVTQTMAQWAEALGLRQGTLRERFRRGWSLEMALEP